MKITFDIGGTHLRVGAFEDGKLVKTLLHDTPADSQAGFALLCQCVEELSPKSEAIAGGVAGFIRDGVIVSSPNLENWNGLTLAQKLHERFNVSVRIINDDALEALGEAHFGAGKEHEIVAYLSLGTGIGGARVTSGSLDRYATSFGPGGQIIDLQKKTTFENMVSGRSIQKHFGKNFNELFIDDRDTVLDTLAVGLHNTIAYWSPDVIVLGGGVSNELESSLPILEEKIASLSVGTPVPILKLATLKDASGLWGGLALLDQKED